MRYPIIQSGANISPCGQHRFSLTRIWDLKRPRITFIGLNPSRADHSYNDATIIRCIRFAQWWTYEDVTFKESMENGQGYKEYGGMYFMNLFSFRTPYVHKVPPEKMHEGWRPLHDAYLVGDAWTEETDFAFSDIISQSKTVVCCWGSWPFVSGRASRILTMIEEPFCLGLNADGSPKHPLYMKSETKLIPYAKGKS